MRSKKFLGVFLAAIVACVMLSVSAFATEPVVAKIGNTPYTSLEAAINAAEDGVRSCCTQTQSQTIQRL